MDKVDVSVNGGFDSSNRWRAWGSIVGATLGILLAVAVALNFLALAIRMLPGIFSPAQTRTPEAIVLFFSSGSALGEILALLILWRVLRGKGDLFHRLGLTKRAPWPGWLAGLAVAAYSVVPAVNGLHNGSMHLPIKRILFDPSVFHVCAALTLGVGAGICEEVFFRGYTMTRLSDAGYGPIVQVIASGFFFGIAHGLYSISSGWSNGLDIMAHTALLGALYGVVYLISGRSLMPSILSHFLNDAIVLPWVFLQMFTMR